MLTFYIKSIYVDVHIKKYKTMKSNFIAMFVVLFTAIAQSISSPLDTIRAENVVYKPVEDGKILSIERGDSILISGIDSVVVVATDSAKTSNLLKIYVDGKVKIQDWFQFGYTTEIDSLTNKTIIRALGGDDNDLGGLPTGLGFILLIVLVVFAGGLVLFRWL